MPYPIPTMYLVWSKGIKLPNTAKLIYSKII